MFEGFKSLDWRSFRLGIITPIILTVGIMFIGFVYSFFKFPDLSLIDRFLEGIKAVWLYHALVLFFGPVLSSFFMAPSRAEDKLDRLQQNFMHGCGYVISAVTIFFIFLNI